MPRNRATGFDKYFSARMKDLSFAREYNAARKDIDSVDEVVRALDTAREISGLTKAELARRADVRPEVVRRLFTAETPNPTLETVVKLATALNFKLELASTRRPPRSRAS